MNRSTTSLTLPDVNVWFALLLGDHVHHGQAAEWWRRQEGLVAFCRWTQTSLLRLLTTAAATSNQPLTRNAALEDEFRRQSSLPAAAPKLWGDAYLLACAISSNCTFVTFDRALRDRGADCLVLG